MFYRIWFITLFLFTTLFANAEVDSGKAWLIQNINQQAIDINSSDLALAAQTSKETLSATQMLNSVSDLDENFVLFPFEDSLDENTTEYLSAKIISYSTYGKDTSTLIIRLLALQNKDGGFGHSSGHQSTALDTALALEVFSQVSVDQQVVSNTVNYLIGKQLPNGAWIELLDDGTNYTTAVAMRALWLHRKSYNLQSYLENAKNYLLSQKDADGSYGEIFESALVLRAIAPLHYDRSALQDTIGHIKSLQQPTGSWEKDIYTTALVLQALFMADKEVPNPDLATLSGTIVDSDTGIALSGITVELEGVTTAATGSDGRFAFSGLQNGTYTLNILSPNHALLHTSVRMIGEDIDLGTLRLNKNADSTISTLKGVIKDAATGTVLDGVTVSIGDKETTTDSSGSYIIDSIEAGTYTLNVQKAGYLQESKTLTIPANTILRYDISLRSFDFTVSANIFGTLTDSETLSSLSDVTVALKDGSSTQNYLTTSDGNFEFRGVSQGEYQLQITKNGYQAVQTTFTIETTQNINYGVIKLQKIDENAPAYATVQGTITDTYTKEPIEGALVDVSGTTVLTAANGSYVLDNIQAEEVTLNVSKDGYLSVSATASLSNGSTLIFSPALKPVEEVSLRLFGTFMDANTSEPLSDVNVTVTGAIEASIFSDPSGYYVIDGLEAGDITIHASKVGYKSVIATTTVTDKSIEFSPTLQREEALSGETTLSGNILDVGNNQPLSGVTLFVNNINTGVQSDGDGNFTIEHIAVTEVNLTLKKEGYKDVNTMLYLPSAQDLKLGTFYMRSNVVDLKPDLVAEAINTSGLANNVGTLAAKGDINVTIANRGTIPSGAFEVYAFYDTNADGNFTEDVDRVFASYRVPKGLNADESQIITLYIDSIADFREQPIYVYVDAKNENVELDEKNLYSTAKSCGGKQGKIDLGICFDYSGSVGSLANLQKYGLVQALRDPAKFPRDGSIRLTIMTATNSTYLNPTIITQENAEDIADQMNNTRFYGGSYVDDCLRYMADKLAALPQQSTYKAITLSGDGYWGSNIAYDRDYAVSKGINVIDAIAVGRSLNWTTLNGIVYPQPSGGEFGKVYRATTSEEVSESLVQTFKKQTEISDLTLGKLEIIDNGSDQNISVRFTVGNAGVATVKSGIDISIYEGDPKANGVLLTTTTLDENLSFGMSTVIQVDDIKLQEGGSIYVVSDAQNNLVECTKENNVIDSIINATTTLGEITPQTDKTSYGVDELTHLSATIINPGRLSYELSARLILEDPNGNIMQAFSTVDLGIVASGENRTISETWNTGTTLAGEYVLRGVLYDTEGNLVDEATTNFRIAGEDQDGVQATLDVGTDRLRYHTTDNVMITNFIESLSSNSIISDAKVVLQITDSSSNVVNTQTLSLSELLPSSTKEANTHYAYTRLPVGEYTVQATLYGNGNNVYASDSVTFEVYEDLTQALKGSVSVAWNSELAGADQTCEYSVTNFGSTALIDVPLELRVMDMNRSMVTKTFARTAYINTTQTMQDSEPFLTNHFEAGDYSCALFAKTGESWTLLDHQPFTVEVPPIIIEGSIEQKGKGRLLVLIDPCDANASCEEPFGSKDALALPGQRSYLESLLTTNGYSYTIVTDDVNFTRELRSGSYSTYLLLDETVKLPKSTQNELREALFKGEGLLVSGTHDSRNHFVYESLGVKYTGHHSKVESVEVIGEGYGYFEDLLLDKTHAVSFDAEGTVRLANYLPEGTKATLPAVVKYRFGQGESLFAGFDLLAEASTHPESSYGNFLLEALADIYQDTANFNAGNIIPMTLEVINEGIATPIRADLNLTSNARFVDAIDAESIAMQSLSFSEDILAEEETKTYRFWIQALQAQSEIELIAHIFSLLDGDEVEQAQFNYSVSVGTIADIESILAQADQIVLTDKQDSQRLKQAFKELEQAQNYMNAANPDEALKALLKATDNLQVIEDKGSVRLLRVMIDQQIREIEIKINRGEE